MRVWTHPAERGRFALRTTYGIIDDVIVTKDDYRADGLHYPSKGRVVIELYSQEEGLSRPLSHGLPTVVPLILDEHGARRATFGGSAVDCEKLGQSISGILAI